MTKTEKLVLWPILAMYVAVEFFAILGICPSPLARIFSFYREGMLSVVTGMTGIYYFLLYAFSRPPRKELIAGVLIGSGLSCMVISQFAVIGRLDSPIDGSLFLSGNAFGLVGLALLVRNFLTGDRECKDRSRPLLVAATYVTIFSFIGDSVLEVTAKLHP